jgi:protein required for attachment to host cells
VRVRILVADESEARFYDADGLHTPLRIIGRILDPSARLHDRDFKSDRPGRVVANSGSRAGRRGSAVHHAVGSERSPRKIEAQRFAQRIADELAHSHQNHSYDRLVVIVGPPFLGTLRAALPDSVRAHVVAEINKDLVHQADDVVRKHLPADVFWAAGAGRA